MSRIAHITRAILAGVSVSALLIATPLVAPSIAPAAAQTRSSISIEFRTALTPYGSWRTVGRWGEVWIPARVGRDWQPYTVGNWVYSEDYGWYWISDSSEAEWGWIAYHYGRWAFDDAAGWVWVPDNVWGPAWVDWRNSDEYVGWSPLPPDEAVVAYRENPKVWTFVRAPELIAPRLRIAALSINQRQTILSRTSVINHTLISNGRRFAVNPGIAPAVIATAARQSVRTVQVRPHVVAGTTDIRGAVEVSADDLRRGGNRPGQSVARADVVQKTINTVEPAKIVQPVNALGNNEGVKPGQSPSHTAVGKQDNSTTNATPINPRQESVAPNKQREVVVPVEQAKKPSETKAQTPPHEERSGTQDRATGGAVGTSTAKQRQESPTPRQQQKQDVVPAERSERTPGTSGQAPARAENYRSVEKSQEQAPMSHAQSTPPPAAKVSVVPPAAAPSKPSAAPAHQDEKRVEDVKKQ